MQNTLIQTLQIKLSGFATLSPFVNRKQLAAYTIASMGALLIFLVTFVPRIMAGITQITPLCAGICVDTLVVLPVFTTLLRRPKLSRECASPFAWVLSWFTPAPPTPPSPDAATVLRRELTSRCQADFDQGILIPKVYKRLQEWIDSDFFSSSRCYELYTVEYRDSVPACRLLLKECPPNLGWHSFYSQTDAWSYFMKQRTPGCNPTYRRADYETISYFIKANYKTSFHTAVKDALGAYELPGFFCENWVLLFIFALTTSVLLVLWFVERYRTPLEILGSEAIRFYWKFVGYKRSFVETEFYVHFRYIIESAIIIISTLTAIVLYNRGR